MVRLIDSDNPETYDRFRKEESIFHAKKMEKIFFWVEKKGKMKVLEIGAGTGTYTKLLGEHFKDITATDLRKEMIDILKSKKIKAKVAVADCLELPYKNASFDLVVGISLLHHIARNDREKFFREINRVLKKNGTLVLSDPNKLNLGTSLYQAMQGEHAISRFEMKNLSEKAGFRARKIGEILVRSPGTSNLLEKLPGWNIFECVLEKLAMGVTVFLVAEKK
mgnify:CR=1 FL=1